MVFSDNTNNTGIVEQARQMMRVDATQYPTYRIVNSVNNYLDTVTGYAITADRNFQWDDTNHTKLPIGTTDLTVGQSDYSFLTDEQGNSILNLTRIDILDPDGSYRELKMIDQANITEALDAYENVAGLPEKYDKIADNIIRIYPKPAASVTAGLKFYFQRSASYFDADDTTKEPGVAPLLHRGFVIAAAYDGALSLGLENLSRMDNEMQREDMKMVKYFQGRNTDMNRRMTPFKQSNR
tara:strand:+ start:540 stop:1256 length:717 start_codon:yes stop_codon:yes gene_type:complete